MAYTIDDMRIYVASLHDYVSGRLVGKWFDLTDYVDKPELMDAIQEYLQEVTHAFDDGIVREEWGYYDYEGFPRIFYSEYHIPFDLFYRLDREGTHDMDIYLIYAEYFGIEDADDIIKEVNDNYYGEYDSMLEFAEEWFEQTEAHMVPQHLRFYFDMEQYARELMFDFDFIDGHVFLKH